MDTHIYQERTGVGEDGHGGNEGEGVNYLRRLKESVPASAPVESAPKDEKVAAAMTALGLKERRRAPRLHCSGSVEFRAEGTDVRMWGTLTDISVHGCYVEMTNTFPTHTKVNLALKSCGLDSPQGA